MKGVLVYPDIRLLDWDQPDDRQGRCCPERESSGYVCTLSLGHLGCHQAWGRMFLRAVWDVEPVAQDAPWAVHTSYGSEEPVFLGAIWVIPTSERSRLVRLSTDDGG